MNLPPLDFAFDYITRSERVDMERLRRLAPRFMARHGAEKAAEAGAVTDPVALDAPGSIEIGFDRTLHPNCSSVAWDNLDRNPDKLAVTGPAGALTYRALCARAAKWGNAFRTAGLAPGSRIAIFLDDTPAYPAAFFGAVRAGFVQVLLNTRTRSELLNYFLVDSDATLAVCEASLASSFDAKALQGTKVERVVIVNGSNAAIDSSNGPATTTTSRAGPTSSSGSRASGSGRSRWSIASTSIRTCTSVRSSRMSSRIGAWRCARWCICAKPRTGPIATTARLQQYVMDRLLPHKYPRIVDFVADLPKTGTGKIDRQALRSRDGEEGR